MARTEAYEYFAFTRFVNQMRERLPADRSTRERVEVPQPPPGAGHALSRTRVTAHSFVFE